MYKRSSLAPLVADAGALFILLFVALAPGEVAQATFRGGRHVAATTSNEHGEGTTAAGEHLSQPALNTTTTPQESGGVVSRRRAAENWVKHSSCNTQSGPSGTSSYCEYSRSGWGWSGSNGGERFAPATGYCARLETYCGSCPSGWTTINGDTGNCDSYNCACKYEGCKSGVCAGMSGDYFEVSGSSCWGFWTDEYCCKKCYRKKNKLCGKEYACTGGSGSCTNDRDCKAGMDCHSNGHCCNSNGKSQGCLSCSSNGDCSNCGNGYVLSGGKCIAAGAACDISGSTRSDIDGRYYKDASQTCGGKPVYYNPDDSSYLFSATSGDWKGYWWISYGSTGECSSAGAMYSRHEYHTDYPHWIPSGSRWREYRDNSWNDNYDVRITCSTEPTAPSPPPAPCSSWKPSNSEYTTGAGSSCQWQCRAGYYKSGDSCNQCETSSCSAAGFRRETCSNAGRTSPAQCNIPCDNYMPSNGEYSGGAEPQGSCPWQCKAGYYKSGNSCVACKTSCPQGQFLGGQSCPAGSTYDTRTCSSCSSSCSIGEYLTGCSGSNAGSCTACPTCGSGEYRQGCTGTNSGSCASCLSDSCGTGQYLDGCGGVSSGTCQTCPSCGANQFRSNCGGTSQGVCQSCNPSLCAPGQYLSGCGGTSRGICQTCTNLPSNARFTSFGSINDPSSCQWECTNGAQRVGDTCVMGCTLDSGVMFKNGETDSRERFEAQVVASNAECKEETQTRSCQAGSFTAFDGTFSYDTCAKKCKTESGEDVMPGDSASRNMYSQQSVPSGTACSAILQVQTKKCNDGKLDIQWSGDLDTYKYNQCEGECAPGCAYEMRGNGQSDGVCNVASCCYDDGDVLAGMMDHMLEARYYAFVGNETAAMKALKEISGDITGRRFRHLSYYEIDDSLEPIRRGNADEQMKVKEAARKQLESFQNGLDVLGMRTNEVDLAAWAAYEKVVETAIEAIKAKQTEIDKAEGYLGQLRIMVQAQELSSEQLSALKSVRDGIEKSIETSFSATAESMQTIKRLVEKNGQQLELSIERTDALADAVRLNSRMLVKQEGLVMQNAQIMMETSSSLHDALGTISMDLKQEIMEGNVKVVGYMKDEFGKITNTLGDITQDLGEIKDITADGVNLIVTTVKNEATETRTAVRAEVNRAIDEISDVVETVGDEIINKTLVAIQASESRITARIGELEDVMLEQFSSISSQLTVLESHLVMMEKRLAQGGGYDLNGDGNVDDAEFAKLLEESGRLSPAALKVLKEFNGAATTDAQGRKLLFIGSVGKFLSNGFDAVKTFASKAFNAVGRTIGHGNAGKLIGTAVESVTGWDVDGDGNVGFADVVDTLMKTGQLVYDGESLWDGYKNLKSQLNNRVPWSRLMDMMKTIDDNDFTGGSTAHGHLRTAVALAHSAYNKGAMSVLTQCDKDAGWSFVSEVKGSSGDGRVVLHKNTKLKTVSVSFRGTINTKDWWINAQFQLTSCTISTSGCGRVHSGFQTRYNDLKSNGLMQKLQDLLSGGSFDTLLVVGHSLGAALATLAAFDLATTNKGITAGKQIKVALFGSPQVGDSDFKAAYLRSVDHTKSVKAKCFVIPDVVTLVPNLAKEASGVIPSSLMPDFLDGAADYVHVVEPIVVKPGKFNLICHQTLDHYADALESMGEVFDRFKGGACSKGAVPAELAGGGGGEVARVASKLFGPNRAKLIKNAMGAVKKIRSMKSSAVTLGKTAVQCGKALSILKGNIAGVLSVPGCVRGIPKAARAAVSIGKTVWNGVKKVGGLVKKGWKAVTGWFGRRRHLLALPVPPPSSADDENVDDILGLKDLEQTLDEYDDNVKAGVILAMKKEPSLKSSNGVSDDMLDSAMVNLTKSRLSSDAAAEYDDLAQQELRSLSPETLGTATDAIVQTSDTYALSVRAWSSKSVQSKALEADSQLEVTTAEYAKSPPSCDSSMPWYKLQNDNDLKPADALEHIQSYYIPYLKQTQSDDIRELLGNVEMYRKQYHYDTLRTSDIDVSKVVSNPPTVAELEALQAKFAKEVQNDISRQGQKGSTMAVAYTIMRQQQPSVFEELITSPRKETSFTIPAPEISRYYNVRMRTVRAYVYPLFTTSSSSSSTVSVNLVKGGASSFFNDDRVLMQFVHQSPKPYLFKYKADTCETVSVPQIDEDNTYIKFSPYGSWSLSVSGMRSEELSRIENIRVEFEISYDQFRDFPEVSPMFANDRVNPSDVDTIPEGADRAKYCERSETKTTSSDSGGVSTTTTAASPASLTTTTQASSPAPSGSPGLPDSSITTSTTTTTASAVSVTTTTSSTSSAEKRSVETSVQLVGLNKASFDAAAQQKFQRGVADTLGDSVSATDVEILAVNEVPSAGGRRVLQQTSPTSSSSALDINFRVNGFESQQEANAAAESFESKVKDGSFVGNLKSLGIPVISVNLVTQVNVYIINPGGNPSTGASSPTPSSPAGGDGGGGSDMMSVVGGAVGASLAILLSVVAYKICRRDFQHGKLSEEREKRASVSKVAPGPSSDQVDIVEDGDDVEGAAGHSSSTKPTTSVVMGVPAADPPPAASSSDIMGAQNTDSKLLRRKSFRTDIPLANWNNENVAHFIESLDMDPTTFEQNSVQGSDLIDLDEATLIGDLGLKPFQAKKLVKEVAKIRGGG
ncbi:TNFR-Cys domain-containing protein [Pseudoscourfieldia marina]